jgi:uncharacterized DUF497 family protein
MTRQGAKRENVNDELFDWDDANILHFAEHNVSPEEAEEVLLGDPLEMGFDWSELGESRWSYIGETLRGRVLQVVITMRGGRIRAVTAYRPTTRDEISYLEYRMERQ